MTEDCQDAASQVERRLDELGRTLLQDLGSKQGVAIALGYIPATVSAELYDTHGLSLIDQEIWGARHDPKLRTDLGGFAWEMSKRGVDVSGTIKEVEELRKMGAV